MAATTIEWSSFVHSTNRLKWDVKPYYTYRLTFSVSVLQDVIKIKHLR